MNWRWRPRPRLPETDTCDSIQPLLSLQTDGMASTDEARRVEAHLAACDECRRAQRWMQATHLAIAQRPAVPPPADLRARIAQAIAAADAPAVRPVRRPLVLRPGFAAAASLVVACLIGGHWLLTAHPASHPVTTPTEVAVVPSPTTVPVVPTPRPPKRGGSPARPATAAEKTARRNVPIPVLPPRSSERIATAVETPGPPAVKESPVSTVPPPEKPAGNSPAHAKAQNPLPRLAVRTPGPTVPIARPHETAHAPAAEHVAVLPTRPQPAAPDVMPDTGHDSSAAPPAPSTLVAHADTPPAPPAAPEPSAPVKVASAERVDPLSGVRANLASFRGDGTSRQVSLDRKATFHPVGFSSNSDTGIPPIYGIVYTPTHDTH